MTGIYFSHRPPPAGSPVVALYGRPVSAAHNASPGTRLWALASRFVPSFDWRDHCIALTASLPLANFAAHPPLAAKALAPRHEQHVSPKVEPQTVLDYALLPDMRDVVGVAGFCFGLANLTRALQCQRWSLAMLAGFSSIASFFAGILLVTTGKELSSPAVIIGCEIAAVAGSLLASTAFDVEDHLQRKSAKRAKHHAPNNPPEDK